MDTYCNQHDHSSFLLLCLTMFCIGQYLDKVTVICINLYVYNKINNENKNALLSFFCRLEI